jgi:hypothetical protein
MGNHHLILGELVDFLTGKTITDTHDERLRQTIARRLVQEKGYAKEQIEPSRPLVVTAGTNRGRITVDFLIHIDRKIAMIIKYGPGSLITRHRPVLAMARLVAPYQVPLAVVTNGKEAHLLDGIKGTVLAEGLDSIPNEKELLKIARLAAFGNISEDRAEKEARIVYCYEIDGSCPCDDTVCRL